jgi:hypothetical protein
MSVSPRTEGSMYPTNRTVDLSESEKTLRNRSQSIDVTPPGKFRFKADSLLIISKLLIKAKHVKKYSKGVKDLYLPILYHLINI